MSAHLRRFVTSPLPMFEYEFASESRAPPPLAAASKCLALCIKLAPGDDFIMSNMYSLLNYISATSKESHDSAWNSQVMNASSLQPGDQSMIQSLKSGLQAFSEDQQRLIGISTISVVTCLASEFKIDEVSLFMCIGLQYLNSEPGDAFDCIDASSKIAICRARSGSRHRLQPCRPCINITREFLY